MMHMPSLRRTAASPLALLLASLVLAPARLPAQSATAASHDYTKADVDFMQGMIIHHAQAVVMSDWAATHGARPDLQTLSQLIDAGQVTPIIDTTYPLNDAPEAIRRLYTGQAHGKLAIQI